jgi:hypothetical protein
MISPSSRAMQTLTSPPRSQRKAVARGCPPSFSYSSHHENTLGRFLQPDPIGFDAGDVNWYRYVFNNVTNLIDPEGLACGSSDGGLGGDQMVPDRFPGGIDFTGPCSQHDACYGTPCFDKKMCDDKFLQDMKKVCHSAAMRNPGVLPGCLLLADIYYRAVRLGGCGAYKKAQKAAGNQNPECT